MRGITFGTREGKSAVTADQRKLDPDVLMNVVPA